MTVSGSTIEPVSPGHGLRREKLQLIVIKAETGESEEASKGLNVKVIESVVTEPQPFNVLQALKGQVRYVYQLVVGQRKKVKRAQLWESSWLDLLYSIVVKE